MAIKVELPQSLERMHPFISRRLRNFEVSYSDVSQIKATQDGGVLFEKDIESISDAEALKIIKAVESLYG